MIVPQCFTVFTAYCGLNSVFGGRLTNCLRPIDPKRTILLSSVHKILCHFSLVQSMCSLANCILFSTCHFFNNGTLWGLLADSLASQRLLLIVAVLKGNFRSSLITLELNQALSVELFAIYDNTPQRL